MIIFKDYLNGGEVCSDAIASTELAGGAVRSYESKKVEVGGGEINTGGNASKEEAEEKLEDEVKTVINLVDSHSLQQIKLEKKEYTTLQNAYWRKLVNELNRRKGVMLFGAESKIPPSTTAEQKEELKKLEAAATTKVNRDPVKAKDLAEIVARLESYKKNFANLQKFIKDEVLANFSEFDFYIAAEPATMDAAMIIPARYIGEALAPTFYYFVDGMYGEKS
jgi:hypothetical protein